MSFDLTKPIFLYSACKMASILKREWTYYSRNMKSNIKIHDVNIGLPKGKLSKSSTVQAEENAACAEPGCTL